VCDLRQFEFLEAREGSYLSHLCGRDAVQVNVRGKREISFRDLSERLGSAGQVEFNEYMLRFRVNSYELTVFPDGRTIVKGTTDEAKARTLYARYIGV
jgi:adenylyltransferase/sulfurtransferase